MTDFGALTAGDVPLADGGLFVQINFVIQEPAEALVLIDLQRTMIDSARPPRNNPQADANAAMLLSAWRRDGRPIIHVRHLSLDPTSGFYPGQPGAEFQEAFKPMGKEHVVDKHVTDAFAGSGLERLLASDR